MQKIHNISSSISQQQLLDEFIQKASESHIVNTIDSKANEPFVNLAQRNELYISDLNFFDPQVDGFIKVEIASVVIFETNYQALVKDKNETLAIVTSDHPIQGNMSEKIILLDPCLSVVSGGTSIQCSRTIKQPSPPKTEAEFIQAGCRYLNEKRNSDALAAFETGQQKYPRDMRMILGQGLACFELKSYYKSLMCAKQVLRISENSTDAQRLLAKSCFALKLYGEARVIAEKLYAQNPKDTQMSELLREMTSEATIPRRHPTTRRLKELVLTEWPRMLTEEKIISKLVSNNIPVDRAAVKGKTLLLFYDDVTKREEARIRLQGLSLCNRTSEFMLANCPSGS